MISLKVELLIHPQGFLHLSLFVLPLLNTFLTVPVLRRGLQKLLRQSLPPGEFPVSPGHSASPQRFTHDTIAVTWSCALHPQSEGCLCLKDQASLHRREGLSSTEGERKIAAIATTL